MTLDEFEKQMIEEIRLFAEVWREENTADPENWPMQMPKEEWLEQIVMHLNGGA